MVDTLRRLFLGFMVATTVAVFAAVPLADASGFDSPHEMHRSASNRTSVVVCGLIAFGLTLALLGPALRGAGAVISALARVENKPKTGPAVAMVICGTTLILSSLLVGRAASVTSSVTGLNESMRTLQDQLRTMDLPGNVSVTIPPMPPVPGVVPTGGSSILPTLVFLVGLGLTGLGVWAIIPAGPPRHPIKTPIPAADATSL